MKKFVVVIVLFAIAVVGLGEVQYVTKMGDESLSDFSSEGKKKEDESMNPVQIKYSEGFSWEKCNLSVRQLQLLQTYTLSYSHNDAELQKKLNECFDVQEMTKSDEFIVVKGTPLSEEEPDGSTMINQILYGIDENRFRMEGHLYGKAQVTISGHDSEMHDTYFWYEESADALSIKTYPGQWKGIDGSQQEWKKYDWDVPNLETVLGYKRGQLVYAQIVRPREIVGSNNARMQFDSFRDIEKRIETILLQTGADSERCVYILEAPRCCYIFGEKNDGSAGESILVPALEIKGKKQIYHGDYWDQKDILIVIDLEQGCLLESEE